MCQGWRRRPGVSRAKAPMGAPCSASTQVGSRPCSCVICEMQVVRLWLLCGTGHFVLCARGDRASDK